MIKVQKKAEEKLLVRILGKGDAGYETSDDKDEDPGLVTVPNVKGKQRAAAGDQVRAVGLKVGSTIYIESTVVPGTVLDQYPKPNEEVAKGSSIKLWVAKKLDVPPIDEEKKKEVRKRIKADLNTYFDKKKQEKEAKLKAKEEAEQRAKEEAEKKAREEAEKKAKEEAEKKAKEEAEKKAREESQRRSRAESQRRSRAESQ